MKANNRGPESKIEEISFFKRRKNRLAEIVWSLINNSIASTSIYAGLVVLDYLHLTFGQLLLILYCSGLQIQIVNDIMDSLYNVIVGSFIIFAQIGYLSLLFIITLFFVYQYIRQDDAEGVNSEMHPVFKIFSFSMVLMRTVAGTLVIAITVLNIADIQNQGKSTLEVVNIFFITVTIILFGFITGINCILMNIYVPNKVLPSSETRITPYILEVLIKIFLFMDLVVIKNNSIHIPVVVGALMASSYKTYLRLYQSLVFNKVIQWIYVYFDGAICLLQLIKVIQSFLDDKYFFVLGLCLSPLWMFALRQIAHRAKDEKVKRLMKLASIKDNFEIFDEGVFLLNEYIRLDSELKVDLMSHLTYHQISCPSNKFNLSEKNILKMLKKKHNSRYIEQDEISLITQNQVETYQNLEQDSSKIVEAEELRSISSNIESNPQSIHQQNTDQNIKHQANLVAPNSPSRQHNVPQQKIRSQQPEVASHGIFEKGIKTTFGQSRFNKDSLNISQGDNIISKSKQGKKQPKQMSRYKMDFIQAESLNPNLHKVSRKQDRMDIQAPGQLFQQSGTKKIKAFEKDIRKYIKHLLNYRTVYQKGAESSDQEQKNKQRMLHYKNKLLQIYFVLEFVENVHLAYFLLVDLVSSQNYSFLNRTQIMIHVQHLEKIMQDKECTLNQKQQQSSTVQSNFNILQMVKINQLYTELQLNLETTTEKINLFWNNLVYERNSVNLFLDGCDISREIDGVKKIYDEIIENNQDKTDTKLFLMMASFFKFVLFKNKEAYDELVNYKQAQSLRIFSNKSFLQDQGDSSEKGFIIADFSFKSEIKLTSMSRQASKITQYESSSIQGMALNKLMPQVVAENHLKFIHGFMNSGKSAIINKRRQGFIKQRSGCIVPVNLLLIVNYKVASSMIMMIEENKELDPFGGDQEGKEGTVNEIAPSHQQTFGVILTDAYFKVKEFSWSCNEICDLNPHSFQWVTDENNISLTLSHLFSNLADPTQEIQDILISNPGIIIETTSNFEELVLRVTSDNEEIRQKYFSHRDPLSLSNRRSLYFMKMWTETYLNSKIVQHVFVIQKAPQIYQSDRINAFNLSQQLNITITQPNQIALDDRSLYQHRSKQILEIQQTQMSKKSDKNINMVVNPSMNQSTSQDPHNQIDLNSVSTTNTSTSQVSSEYMNFSKFSTSGRDIKLPSSIKIIFQLVIIVSILILTTSIVDLVLTMQNITDAKDSIYFGSLAYQILNQIRYARPCLRNMVNIVNGFQEKSTVNIPDRFAFYSSMSNYYMTRLKTNLNILNKNSLGLSDKYDLFYLDSRDNIYKESSSFEQIQLTYVNQVSDLLEKVKLYGTDILLTQQENLNVFYSSKRSQAVTLTDRQLFFVIYNQNLNIYDSARDFGVIYIADKIKAIQVKNSFLDKINLICFAITLACGIIIIPLTLRVNSRLQKLMGLFFQLDKQHLEKMIQSISLYQSNQKKAQMQNKFQHRELTLFQQIDQDVEQAKVDQQNKEVRKSKQADENDYTRNEDDSRYSMFDAQEYMDEEKKEQQNYAIMKKLSKQIEKQRDLKNQQLNQQKKMRKLEKRMRKAKQNAAQEAQSEDQDESSSEDGNSHKKKK